MSTKNILKILSFWIFVQTGWGQELPVIIPPSPEASSLGEYIESPVSYYTGTPNINIPIYTIQSKGIEIPVSLSYHAKGVAVSEMASRVGLGWSLNAGGLISRQIRGQADESEYGYLKDSYTSTYFSSATTRERIWNEDAQAGPQGKDLEPDLFQFNFMGYSGKFIIDHVTKNPILQTASDIKITFSPSSGLFIDQFILTTPDGTKFYFGKNKNGTRNVKDGYNKHTTYKYTNDSSGYQSFPQNSPTYHNSWQLVEIETIKKGKIEFYYTPEDVIFYNHNGIDFDLKGTKSINYEKVNQLQQQLNRIDYDEGSVFFISGSQREDLLGSKELQSIEIKNKTGVSIKKYNFLYSYTQSIDNNTVLPDLLIKDSYAKKRMFLEKVSEISTDNQEKTYQFEYNTELLPNRHSNDTDNWGYYNGANNHYLACFYDANRVVNTQFSEAGLLKKVYYPTGGYAAFEYEHNKVIPPSFYNELLVSLSNPSINKSFGMLKSPSEYINGKFQKSLSIDGRVTSLVSANVFMDITDCPLNTNEESPGCKYDVFIKKNNGALIAKLRNGNNNLSLLQGEYVVEVVPKNTSNFDPYFFDENLEFNIVINWTQQQINELDEILAAGKRIKRIIKGEGTNVFLEKEYVYLDNSGKSSGKTHSLPHFFTIRKTFSNGGNLIRGTHSGSPLSQFAGGEIGYSKVTEITKGNNQNYKSEYFFTNFENLGTYYKPNFHLPVDLSWARGLSTETYHYKTTDNNTYIKIKSSSNFYTFYNDVCDPRYPLTNNLTTCFSEEGVSPIGNYSAPYIVGSLINKFPLIKPFLYWEEYPNGIPDYTNPNKSEEYRVSYFLGGRMYLSKTFEKDLTTGKTIISSFKHENTQHTNLTEQSTTNSSGETLSTHYAYAHEKGNQALIAKNMVGIPLETRVTKSGLELSKQETTYNDWGNGILAPQYIKTSKAGANMEVRVKYNLVDTENGNPLEVQQEGGQPICYIWGYYKTLPIAKIENATYAQVQAHAANLQILSNGNDENALLQALEALRNDPALSSAMISTYTHKPLVGLSSATDPKGNKVTYHYDAFNRLEFVKDKDGNILSENQYHYKN